MRRTPSTDKPLAAANARSEAPSARAERSAALRRSVHTLTFSDAVDTSDTSITGQLGEGRQVDRLTLAVGDCRPQELGHQVIPAFAVGRLPGTPQFFDICGRGNGSAVCSHVNIVDDPTNDVNRVDAP